MSSFEAVQRNGVHVGVKHNPSGIILDLTDSKDYHGLAEIKTVKDDGSWDIDPSWTPTGSDADITFRWNKVVALWNECQSNGKIFAKYDAAGDLEGANCENLVGYVLEGDPNPALGHIARLLKEAGINLTKIARSSRGLSKSIS